MTPTLYPHEWILKRIDGADMFLCFAVAFNVWLCMVNQRYLWLVLSILPLGIGLGAVAIVIYYMSSGQHYGRGRI